MRRTQVDEASRQAAADVADALTPLEPAVKAMFGGYCFYVDSKVVGLICDGRVFLKRSSVDDRLADIAELAPAYPGARDSWRLPASFELNDPARLLALVKAVAESLPPPRKKTRTSAR